MAAELVLVKGPLIEALNSGPPPAAGCTLLRPFRLVMFGLPYMIRKSGGQYKDEKESMSRKPATTATQG
jgi:hypothetical protein